MEREGQEPETLLTVDDLGRRLQKPNSWIYNNIGVLPSIRVGRQLRFRAQAVEAWLDGLPK